MFTSETPICAAWCAGAAPTRAPRAALAQVGLGDDLDQRRAAAVEVDERGAGAVDPARLGDVDQLRRVLLEVDAVDPHVAEPARGRQRQVVLADLVGLRVVGIEVVLAVEDRARRELALEREARSAARRSPPARWSPAACPGWARQIGQVCIVRLVAEGELAAAEHLRPRPQLDVDLEPDDRLVALAPRLISHSPARPDGPRPCRSGARSRAARSAAPPPASGLASRKMTIRCSPPTGS